MNQKLITGLIAIGAGLLFFVLGEDDKKISDKPELEKELESIPDIEPEYVEPEQPKNFFTARSQAILSTCHPDLVLLFNEVLKEMDCTIIEGYRNKSNQDEMFEKGNSQLQFPNSRHNVSPSQAVDVAPYNKEIHGIDWNDTATWDIFAGVVKRIATEMNISVTWGGDWQTFIDKPHWELKE